jgi:2-oxoglutarate ferredoxin oxidoreductase subunit alpha
VRVNRLKLLVGGVQLRDGVTTVTDLLGKIFTRAGLYAIAMEKGYASTIYGAHQYDPMLVSETPPVSYGDPDVDILVALDYDTNPDAKQQPNRDTVLRHGAFLRDGGTLLYDASSGEIPTGDLEGRGVKVFPIPARKIAQGELKKEVVKNIIMTGALFRLVDFDDETKYLKRLLEERFLRKGRELVDLNLQAVRRGSETVEKILTERGYELELRLEPRPAKQAVYVSGNDCLGAGAIAGGVRFYAGYPITPASGILEFMEQYLPKYGGRVLQGQNERESIRAAIGAALSGVRSMIGSSGPGISLKVEEIGVVGTTETPVIVVDAQRAGPSTGMPTRPEQGDLNLILGAGHGDIPRIVIAPGTIEECYTLMLEACELSDKYQCPVFFLTDLNLSEGKKTVGEDVFAARPRVTRHAIVREDDVRGKTFRRYEITESGISPRSVPGTPGAIFKTSGAEHDEFGFVTIDPAKRAAMMEKRMRKMNTYLREDWKPPQVFGKVRGNPVIAGWGNTRPVLEEARAVLEERGVPAALVHFTHVYPLRRDALDPLFADAGPVVVVEQNYSGQFADLLQRELLIPTRRVLKYNGIPMYPTEVANAVQQALERDGAVVRIGSTAPVKVEVGRNEHEGD